MTGIGGALARRARVRVGLRLLLMACSVAAPSFAHESVGYRFAAVAVDRVVDGDTFVATLHVHPMFGDRAKVRVLGIDTPEIRGKCLEERELAVKARDRLGRLLTDARRVDLVNASLDSFGRILARVAADGVDVGEQLVAEGLARRWAGKREGWCR